MRLLLVTLGCLLLNVCAAQKETAHWFLNGSRMRVEPGGVSNLATTEITPYLVQSNTSISDAEGNLLFTCDGRSVYNKHSTPMPALTGLTLKGSGIVMIAPVPNSSRYYVFYGAPNDYSRNGSWTLYYALVDMSLAAGLGDVVRYDQVVDNSVSKGFTLAAGEGEDTWLVTHQLTTTTFKSYKISAAGLEATPVVSNAGSLYIPQDYIFNELKASHNGKMIAGIAYRDYTNFFAETYKTLEVFHFNAQTGRLSNKIRTTRRYSYFVTTFSLEFSPDNRLLYAGEVERIYGLQPCGYGFGMVTQYNLCYTDTTDFTNLSMVVASNFVKCYPDVTWGRIQMGADKKIYMPYTGTTVSAINYPNRIGTACDYRFNAHQVLRGNSQVVGTPVFYHREMEKAVKNNILYAGGCFPDPVSFRISNDTIASVAWNFGDPGSGAANTATGKDPTHVFSAPGLYTVTAALYNRQGNWMETVTELIEIKDPGRRLLADYPMDTAFCSGQSLTLHLSAVNGIVNWKTKPVGSTAAYSLGVSDSLTITSAGVYYAEMRQNDCQGCILVDSIRVNVLPVPYLSFGPQASLCSGDSLQLTVFDPAATTIWSTGETTPSIWVKNGGIYWAEAEINQNGCPVRDSIQVSLRPGISFSLPGDTTLCSQQTLLLSPGVVNATYQWQNGSTQTDFTVTGPGSYWVTVTAANGCRKTDSIRVAYVDGQSVTLGNDTTLCAGSSLPLEVAVPNGLYEWSTGSTASRITVMQTGSYWVKVTNGACTVTDTIHIRFTTPPALSLGSDTTICEADRLVLRPGLTGRYNWSTGHTTDSLVVTRPGKYWVQLADGGCVVADTIQVAFKPRPPVDLGGDAAFCAGSSLLLSAEHPSIASYQWQDGLRQSSYRVTQPGTYWVQVRGLNGCINADTVTLTAKPLPVFDLGPDTTLCMGEGRQYSFSLTAASYQWSTGASTNTLAISQPGLYWLEITQNGCSRRDSVNISFRPLPVVQLGNDTTLCEGQTLVLNAFHQGASYQWSTGTATATYTVTQPGTYWVTAMVDGCRTRDTIRVDYTLLPRFSLGPDTALCTGQSLVLAPAADAGSYLWQDGSSGTSFTVSEPGTYRLTVTNTCGSSSDAVEVKKGVCQLYMPNAFTPNNDGKNDRFRVPYPAFINSFRMQIFNRWGEVIFSTTNPYEGWNGKRGNIDQPADAYVWTIALTDKDGNRGSYKGTVILIR